MDYYGACAHWGMHTLVYQAIETLGRTPMTRRFVDLSIFLENDV